MWKCIIRWNGAIVCGKHSARKLMYVKNNLVRENVVTSWHEKQKKTSIEQQVLLLSVGTRNTPSSADMFHYNKENEI